MRIFEGSEALAAPYRGCVLTIGNFDGIHLGHQALLRAVAERARELSEPAVVYTFEPHPRRVLQPERAEPRLMTWPQLEAGLAARGVDALIREPFTLEFAAQSAESFLGSVIHARIAPSEIFIGRDFHFGKGRGGSGETLAHVGPGLGIRVVIIAQVRTPDGDVSSTRIREALAAGDVPAAARSLGSPYAIWGRVVEGDRRGRELGFPTANVEPENEQLIARGVYATRVRLFEGAGPAGRALPAVTNVGTRPTFHDGRLCTEAHLLDFAGDLSGRRVEVAFLARIREERRFAGPEALARQIQSDVARARELVAAAP